jgi:hypothetical protein
MLRLLNPDPVTISTSSIGEKLDVFIWHDKTKDAYGWNNEAYFSNWKPAHYALKTGKYKLEVHITTQNGKSLAEDFIIKIGTSIKTTSIYHQ